jgi:methylated-DNA-[protein]-cysteine S-methyltransferase
MGSDEKAAWIGSVKGTPLGELWVAVSTRGLVAVEFPSNRADLTWRLQRMGFTQVIYDRAKVGPVLEQIQSYLDGQLQTLDLKIDWSVLTSFQRQVLQETCAIPYGQTATYRQIAERVSRPRAARAVGRAQATNPMPLVIPCHRVLGTDGKLHGYGAGDGIATKAWLLKLEAGNAER